MAMVEKPDLIMTTGGYGGGGDCGWGGNGMWILLLAFLFMFRGRDGFGGGGHDGGGYGYGGGCSDPYRRYDADFNYLKRDNWDLQKEGLVGRYEARIADLECCCKTNANIEGIRCEVKDQGEKTRCLMENLQKETVMEAMRAKISALETAGSEARIINGVLDRLGHWRAHPCEPRTPIPVFNVCHDRDRDCDCRRDAC